MLSKVILLGVLLVAVCYVTADKVSVKQTLTPIQPGKPVFKLNGERVSNNFQLPPDDGRSNWGDQILKQRQSDDVLLLRDLVVYPSVSSQQQTLKYTARFNNIRSITSVRLINVGRERAFGNEIDVYNNGVDVIYTLPEESDPRVFIEVYGYDD